MARLDFLWQLQARDEKLDMEALQGSNRLEIIDKDGRRNCQFYVWSTGLRPEFSRFYLGRLMIILFLMHLFAGGFSSIFFHLM